MPILMSSTIRRSFYSTPFALFFLAASAAFPLALQADAPAMTAVLRQEVEVARFPFCDGGTCAEVRFVGLEENEWAEVRAMFMPPPETAEAERRVLREAIGLLERIVGPKTGTATDRAGTFGNSAWAGQLDCNDEAANSTTYMRLMAADGLLRFHRIEDTRTRGGFLFFGRHSTAVISETVSETASGRHYAVDSWFYDNGHPAEILPLEQWKNGWKPAESAAR